MAIRLSVAEFLRYHGKILPSDCQRLQEIDQKIPNIQLLQQHIFVLCDTEIINKKRKSMKISMTTDYSFTDIIFEEIT